MEPTPLLLFVYNRLDTLIRTVRALQKNDLAARTDLIIFSDHPRSENDREAVAGVRSYIRTIDGFRKVQIKEAAANMGLAKAIITGVTDIIDQYGRVIVLEDDLETSSNFLSFMNGALEHYQDKPGVFSVGGYSQPMRHLHATDVYFTLRATSWGWATWKDRWQTIDWVIKDYDSFRRDKVARMAFNRMGSDLSGMLDLQMKGEIDSWAIRFCYQQFKQGRYTVFPAVSKVNNIGFVQSATHTRDKFNRFTTELDQTGNKLFQFTDDIRLDQRVLQRFRKPYSISIRLKYKLLNLFPRIPLLHGK